MRHKSNSNSTKLDFRKYNKYRRILLFKLVKYILDNKKDSIFQKPHSDIMDTLKCSKKALKLVITELQHTGFLRVSFKKDNVVIYRVNIMKMPDRIRYCISDLRYKDIFNLHGCREA